MCTYSDTPYMTSTVLVEYITVLWTKSSTVLYSTLRLYRSVLYTPNRIAFVKAKKDSLVKIDPNVPLHYVCCVLGKPSISSPCVLSATQWPQTVKF